MPSLARAIVMLVPAAALLILFDAPFVAHQALAKPIHGPILPRGTTLSLLGHPTRDLEDAKASRLKSFTAHKTNKSGRPSKLSAPIAPKVPSGHDRREVTEARMANAKQYYVNATSYAATYQKLAAQSKSTTSNDPQHQRETAAALSGFSYNILGFQTALAELGADEGLANYDRTNDLETLLKNVVNVNKGVLTTTSVLVDDIPVLGPILGPTVYDIKCVLDEILDTCENLTDATINALQPLLKTVIGQATTAACHSGVEVAGLCI